MKQVKFERKIISQGEFDGACFLYAVANSFLSLTDKKPTQFKWDKAIDTLPFKEDFLKGNVGTERCFTEGVDMRSVVTNILIELSKQTKYSFTVTYHKQISRLEELCTLINKDSLVLFCLDQEHWVIGSSFCADLQTLNIACSFQHIENSSYFEKTDNDFERPYNAYTKKKNLDCKGTVFSIALEN